jgi:hypothetical protein
VVVTGLPLTVCGLPSISHWVTSGKVTKRPSLSRAIAFSSTSTLPLRGAVAVRELVISIVAGPAASGGGASFVTAGIPGLEESGEFCGAVGLSVKGGRCAPGCGTVDGGVERAASCSGFAGPERGVENGAAAAAESAVVFREGWDLLARCMPFGLGVPGGVLGDALVSLLGGVALVAFAEGVAAERAL